MSHTKSNADHLRELINSDSYSKDEAMEFIQAMEEELKETEQSLKEEETAREQAEDELAEQPELTKVFLGLDTIHYYLENKNLRVTEQLESSFNSIKNG